MKACGGAIKSVYEYAHRVIDAIGKTMQAIISLFESPRVLISRANQGKSSTGNMKQRNLCLYAQMNRRIDGKNLNTQEVAQSVKQQHDTVSDNSVLANLRPSANLSLPYTTTQTAQQSFRSAGLFNHSWSGQDNNNAYDDVLLMQITPTCTLGS